MNLLPHHGEALFFPAFLPQREADDYYQMFLRNISWQHQAIRIFGRSVMQPRLTASFADKGVSYGYSGIALASQTWFPELSKLKSLVEKAAGTSFNTALLNLYRDGNDSMGWHRDNEKELGPAPVIASVSLGAGRKFQLREYGTGSNLVSLVPGHGSLILMSGESQHFWEHRVPKEKKVHAPRVNVTFRKIVRVRKDH